MILNEYDSIYSGEQVDLGVTRALKLPDNVDEVLANIDQNATDIVSVKGKINEHVDKLAKLQKQVEDLTKLLESTNVSSGLPLHIYGKSEEPVTPETGSLTLFAGTADSGVPTLMVRNASGTSYVVGRCELQAVEQDDRLHLEIKELILN